MKDLAIVAAAFVVAIGGFWFFRAEQSGRITIPDRYDDSSASESGSFGDLNQSDAAANNERSAWCAGQGGEWLSETSECEFAYCGNGGVSCQTLTDECSAQGGTLSECTSPCRNVPEAQACAAVCVPVCAL